MIFLERLSEFGLAFINFDYIQTSDQKQQNCIYKTSIFTIFCHFILDTEPKVQNLIQDDIVCIINNVCFMTNAQDTLYGGAGSDTLIGGSGYDTYITDNGDKVYDQDGIGHVEFYGITLTGGTQMEGIANTYEGNGGVYTLNPNNKILTFTKNGTSVEIHNFDKASNELGIVLEDSDSYLGVDIYGPYVQEDEGTAMGAITISRTFDYDVTLRLYTQADTATAGDDYTNHLGVAK